MVKQEGSLVFIDYQGSSDPYQTKQEYNLELNLEGTSVLSL